MNLRGVDLNLLVIFDALYNEGSQSRAGAKLGMSQPAMSNSLGRLRSLFNDKLFIRTPSGMVPTVQAHALAESVREALGIISSAVDLAKRGRDFHYATSNRSVVMSVEDIGEAIVLPRFIAWLTTHAPCMNLSIHRNASGRQLSRKLADGSIELALHDGIGIDPALKLRRILNQDFVSLVRKGHKGIGSTISLSQYVATPHVIYGRVAKNAMAASLIDNALRKLGLSRHIAVLAPSFLSMPLIIKSTDYICTLPRRIANEYAEGFGMKVLELPLEIPALPLYLIWGEKFDRDPGHIWVRDSIAKLFE